MVALRISRGGCEGEVHRWRIYGLRALWDDIQAEQSYATSLKEKISETNIFTEG